MLGLYLTGDSWLHRTDPRTKLALGVLLLVLLMVFHQPSALLWLGFLVLCAGPLAGFSLRLLLAAIQPVLPLAFLTMIFHAFWGEAPFWKWISLPGLERGGVFAYRIVVLVLFAQLLTVSTSPVRLCEGLEKLMRPLSWFKVPVHEVALAASIALRFVPILSQEMERLIKAQVSRGACLDQGPWARRLPAILSILVPLFVRAFRYADDLAQAMEARGFVAGAPRTRLHPLRWTRLDFLVLGAGAALMLLPLLL